MKYLVFAEDGYQGFYELADARGYAERAIGWARDDGWPEEAREVEIAVYTRIESATEERFAGPGGTRFEYRLTPEPDERDEQIAAFRDVVAEKDREIAALTREIAALRASGADPAPPKGRL